jgi:hypothetical protein
MAKIVETKWEKSFTKDISEKLIYAEKEFQLYQDTGYVIYLQQAGNKLFSAVENWLMLKYKKRVRSYQQLLQLIQTNQVDSLLAAQASQLHYFFYNGELQMSKQEAVILYKNVYRKMKQRVQY